MLKNDYLVAKIGADTAENEPRKKWRSVRKRMGAQAHRLALAAQLATEPAAHRYAGGLGIQHCPVLGESTKDGQSSNRFMGIWISFSDTFSAIL